ncbi:hypothetical protein NM688_g6719 [Phlebia brevispora]|uniref:Uncharacterized protein n=1 Tax=Phlebia brevispora TaxID=194682 RepID=A0ACC1SDA6_9APHY|nr:hypothetical protein NM688_g6719 [Phlebia brevispora]
MPKGVPSIVPVIIHGQEEGKDTLKGQLRVDMELWDVLLRPNLAARHAVGIYGVVIGVFIRNEVTVTVTIRFRNGKESLYTLEI